MILNGLSNWLLSMFQVSVSLLTILFQLPLDNRERLKAREDIIGQKGKLFL